MQHQVKLKFTPVLICITLVAITLLSCADKYDSLPYKDNAYIDVKLEVQDKLFNDLVNNSKAYYNKTINQETYGKSNNWIKAKITFNDSSYSAKIKAHGKTPFQHFNGEIMSIKVKLKKNKTFRNMKTFSLVIIEREKFMYSKLNPITTNLNLHQPNYQRGFLKINSGKKHLITIEQRINNAFAKQKQGSNAVIIKSKNFKTPLFVFNSSTHPERKTLSLKELGSIKYSENVKNTISNINYSITDKDATFSQFIDTNYFVNYLTCLKILGADPHGFLPHNFICIMDTITNKIYPIIDRDIGMKCIYNKSDLTSGTVNWWFNERFHYNLPILETLTTDRYLDSLSDIKTIEYFENNSFEYLLDIEKNIEFIARNKKTQNELQPPSKTSDILQWNLNFWLKKQNPIKKIKMEHYTSNNNLILTINNITSKPLKINQIHINQKLIKNVKIQTKSKSQHIDSHKYVNYKHDDILPNATVIMQFELNKNSYPKELSIKIQDLQPDQLYYENKSANHLQLKIIDKEHQL